MEGRSLQSSDNMTNPFTIVHTAVSSGLAARVGKLVLPGRKPIQTPHYVAITSRGVVPHLSPDVLRNSTSISSLYIGLEDFWEKVPKEVPPVLNVPQNSPHESRLRKFIAAQDDDILILGARRAKPLVTAQRNLSQQIAILTLVGSRYLKEDSWLEAVETLRPDIVVGLADIAYGHPPGVKKREAMVDNTHAYTRDGTKWLYKDAEQDLQTLYFAPVLPLENTQQRLYLQDLEDEFRSVISGLALYESASLAIVPKGLDDLPRLCFSEPRTPQEVLRDVALGADLLTIPFIGELTDVGTALEFVFSPKKERNNEEIELKRKPLGFNLWDTSLAAQVVPISEGCQCYTCQKHHRAYIHHLLSAKEMLAWSLLQIHNNHVMDLFFTGVRQSIADGTFEADSLHFERTYESTFPAKTGQGPRIRGYNSRISGPGEAPRNAPAYGRLNDALEKYAESQRSSVATPDVDAEELEKHGFAEKSSGL